MPTIWALDNIENKHSLYCGEDFMKKFSLREHAANLINFEKMTALLITEKQLKSHQDSTLCHICRKNYQKSLLKIKIILMLLYRNEETVDAIERNSQKKKSQKNAKKVLIVFLAKMKMITLS